MASGGGGVESQNVRVRVQHAERACARRTLLVRAQISCSKRTAYAAGPRSGPSSNLVLEQVRVVGLQKAAHHNGKVGKISRRKADAPDRVGIDLEGGESFG